MTLQTVRGAMEAVILDALVAGGLAAANVYWQNVQETPPDHGTPWATVTISFPRLVLPSIGCEGDDAILGTVGVLLYWPKQEGPAPAEAVLTGLVAAWCDLNHPLQANPARLRTRNQEGPTMTPPGSLPWATFSASCSFTGKG